MMKGIYGAVLLTAAVLVLAATASAQNLPSQFVISGETARRIHDFSTINLATAERIAETCERLASKEGVAISVYILDNDGNHVYMHRMDGQGYVNIVTAEMKARTALLGREPSKNRMNRVLQDPTTELQQIQLGFFPNSGGLPITVNDQLIGAIVVAGRVRCFRTRRGEYFRRQPDFGRRCKENCACLPRLGGIKGRDRFDLHTGYAWNVCAPGTR